MISNTHVKWAAYGCLFACVSVGIVVAGIIIGFLITLLTPILIVFTGLWVWRVINAEADEESPSDAN